MEFLKNVPWSKVGKIVATAVSAGMAVVGVLSDQKKNMEFEQMKKDLENLKEIVNN